MTDKAVNSTSKQNGEVIKTIEACLSEVEGLEIAHSREYPAVAPPGLSANDLPIRPALKDYLTKTYPGGLFTHQHIAIERIFNGHNVVVNTRTASGKSLIFTIPAFEAFLIVS